MALRQRALGHCQVPILAVPKQVAWSWRATLRALFPEAQQPIAACFDLHGGFLQPLTRTAFACDPPSKPVSQRDTRTCNRETPKRRTQSGWLWLRATSAPWPSVGS